MIYLHIDNGPNKGKYVFNSNKEKDDFMEAHENDTYYSDYWISYDGHAYVNYIDFPQLF